VVDARAATPDDAPELVRLRRVMLAAVTGTEPQPGAWQQTAEETLRKRLADGSLAVFVVEQPDAPGCLAACVVGAIEHRLGGPANPAGRVGYVFSVATDPGHRRRGYSRACMQRLLDWYRKSGVTTVDLRASPEAEPLYRSLGFERTRDPAMRLTLPS
jgi:GNAT superfamily N-acetyltransferase